MKKNHRLRIRSLGRHISFSCVIGNATHISSLPCISDSPRGTSKSLSNAGYWLQQTCVEIAEARQCTAARRLAAQVQACSAAGEILPSDPPGLQGAASVCLQSGDFRLFVRKKCGMQAEGSLEKSNIQAILWLPWDVVGACISSMLEWLRSRTFAARAK